MLEQLHKVLIARLTDLQHTIEHEIAPRYPDNHLLADTIVKGLEERKKHGPECYVDILDSVKELVDMLSERAECDCENIEHHEFLRDVLNAFHQFSLSLGAVSMRSVLLLWGVPEKIIQEAVEGYITNSENMTCMINGDPIPTVDMIPDTIPADWVNNNG